MLENKDSSNQIILQKEQETEENNFLIENQNILKILRHQQPINTQIHLKLTF